MSWLDTAILVVLLFSAVLGLYWGAIRQALSLFGLLAGLALAQAHTVEVADLLSSVIVHYTIALVLAFILIMLSVSAAASLLASLIRKFAGLLFMGWLDHAIGAVLGLFQGLLFCTAILLVANIFPNESWKTALQESQFASVILATVGSMITPFLPPFMSINILFTRLIESARIILAF